MKKRVSTTALLAVAFCFCFILFQITIFQSSTFLTANYSIKTQGKTRESSIICGRKHPRYDLCSINGPVVLDPTSSTFFTMSSAQSSLVERVRPYPRKFEEFIMGHIKDITLTSSPRGPSCKVQHKAPALVFSAGGYTGNFFHDFNDGFIPLFITINTLQLHQDLVIVVSEASDWWLSKYAELLDMFTKHTIITLGNDTTTHCFPSAHIGLMSHGFMTINQTLIPNSKTLLHFRELLEKAYTQQVQRNLTRDKRDEQNKYGHPSPKSFTFNSDSAKYRPRLVLIRRNNVSGRMIMNEEQVVEVMKDVGFDVIEFEPTGNTSMDESYAVLNSSHAMVGVHGAALTHALFLRPGSVFVQVVPIGVEWAADVFYGRIGRGLNLEYSEYRIEAEESSLVDKYGKDNLMIKNPFALQKKGWPTQIMNIYLKEQNVKLDLLRFRGYLRKAYNKAHKFMEKEC